MKKKITLFEHQKKAIELARAKKEFALFFDLGTGKTLTTIMIIDELFEKNKNYKALIVCPLSVVQNWYSEIDNFSKNIDRYVVLDGTIDEKGKKLVAIDRGVAIVNIDVFSRGNFWRFAIVWRPEILVLDESHYVKEHGSARSKNLYRLAEHTEYRYILTGTPILNSAMDIYQQYKILDLGKTFGKNFYSFRSQYFYDANSAWAGRDKYYPKWLPIKSKYDELSRKIYSKAMRVLKEDCLDLPPVIYRDIQIELTKQQKSLYDQMKKNLIAQLVDESGKISRSVAKVALTKVIRLQQIVCGHLVSDTGEVIEIDVSTRLEVLENELNNILPKKVIIWCVFKKDYDVLDKFLKKRFINAKYTFLTGEQTAEERQKAIDDFNTGHTNILIANPASGGTGINLTAAGYDITWSKNFNLAHYLQSHDRNNRIGSEIHKNIIKISIIAKNTIDETITNALKNKQIDAETIVNKILTN